jgi:cell shape-determining protein MreD
MSKLIILVLIAGYVGLGWKFWSGYTRTNFTPSLLNRIALSLLWPALFIVNKSYRRNFRKALKG